MPALLTSTSRRSGTWSASARTALSEARSPTTSRTSPGPSSSSASVSRPRSSLRAWARTVAPRRARRVASARPRPSVAPVTRTVLIVDPGYRGVASWRHRDRGRRPRDLLQGAAARDAGALVGRRPGGHRAPRPGDRARAHLRRDRHRHQGAASASSTRPRSPASPSAAVTLTITAAEAAELPPPGGGMRAARRPGQDGPPRQALGPQHARTLGPALRRASARRAAGAAVSIARDRVGLGGPREVVALAGLAGEGAQHRDLLGGLDALRHGLQARANAPGARRPRRWRRRRRRR